MTTSLSEEGACTFGPLMQHGGDAEDVAPADVRHRRLDHALTVLQAAITLEGFPGAVPVSPLGAAENLQILTVRHQHDLWSGGHMTLYRRPPPGHVILVTPP